jgi:hypothetical protein
VKKANSERKTSHSREETRIQEEFFRKVPILLPNLPEKLLFAVPNGGSRNKAEAASLKRQGVKAGVADVILQMPGSGYGSLAIEFKAKTGRQSPSQIEFQKQTEKAGNKYVICKSAFDAIKAIMEYLNIRI